MGETNFFFNQDKTRNGQRNGKQERVSDKKWAKMGNKTRNIIFKQKIEKLGKKDKQGKKQTGKN